MTSFANFAVPNVVYTVNGRQITDWGQTNPPVVEETIDPVGNLHRGQGGGAAITYRNNPGKRITMNLMPGSPDSAYMQGLVNSRAVIEVSKGVISTLEAATGSQGIITTVGQTGRAGTDLTDDQYVIELNVWNETKGGDGVQ